jgi:hypothetical protein
MTKNEGKPVNPNRGRWGLLTTPIIYILLYLVVYWLMAMGDEPSIAKGLDQFIDVHTLTPINEQESPPYEILLASLLLLGLTSWWISTKIFPPRNHGEQE